MKLASLLSIAFAALAVGVAVPAPITGGAYEELPQGVEYETRSPIANTELVTYDLESKARCKKRCLKGWRCDWCFKGKKKWKCCVKNPSISVTEISTRTPSVPTGSAVVKREDPALTPPELVAPDSRPDVECNARCPIGSHCEWCVWRNRRWTCCIKGLKDSKEEIGAPGMTPSVGIGSAIVRREDPAIVPPFIPVLPRRCGRSECFRGYHCSRCGNGRVVWWCCLRNLSGEQDGSPGYPRG